MSAIEIRMLVVDDDEDMRATLTDFIPKMGVKVRQAANLEEARRFLGNDADPYDVVITDLRLPDGNGLEVVRAAHSRRPDTLVTIVTGYASLETAIEAIRLGAYDYITKPFSLDEIGVQVRNMVDRISLAKENARLMTPGPKPWMPPGPSRRRGPCCSRFKRRWLPSRPCKRP